MTQVSELGMQFFLGKLELLNQFPIHQVLTFNMDLVAILDFSHVTYIMTYVSGLFFHHKVLLHLYQQRYDYL